MQRNPPFSSRRSMLKATAGLVAGAALPAVAQSGFPRRPVRFIVPLTAGGVADVATRAAAAELTQLWGQPVVVDNRTGGMFVIAMQALMQSPADGHTLLFLFNSMPTIQVVHKKFDLSTEVIPVTQSFLVPMVILVKGDSPHRTLRDLVAFGKANPEMLTYASLGPGSVEHLKAVQLEKIGGFRARNVPYKAGPDMVKDVIAGNVDFVLTALSFATMFVPKGQLRALGVFDNARVKELPDMPTVAEAGFAVPPLSFWGGYAVRAGTPPDLVQALHRDLSRVVASPAVAEKLVPLSVTARGSRDPEEFRTVINSDLAWMTDIAKDLDIKTE